jgi:hypothetical protein
VVGGKDETDKAKANGRTDRLSQLGIALKPWRAEGEYWLICGQVRGDKSTIDNQQILRWYVDVAKEAERLNKPVWFRPHPLNQSFVPPGVNISHGSLDDALNKASLVITWSSNAAVDAVIAGVPVCMGSEYGIAWPMASHWPDTKVIQPNRETWLQDVSYSQWTMAEIQQGDILNELATWIQPSMSSSSSGTALVSNAVNMVDAKTPTSKGCRGCSRNKG